MANQSLVPVGADINQTSVSGLSSGAYMAGQFQIAHSKIVVGAGIIAGGPYGCAESWQARNFSFLPGVSTYNAAQAVQGCMKTNLRYVGVPNIDILLQRAKSFAEDDEIDPLSDLKDDKIYVFSGKNDQIVEHEIVDATVEFYERIGVPDQNITYVKRLKAGHALVTETYGGSCELSAKPYIVDCDYDQAGEILKHIYGHLQDPASKVPGQIISFDQTAFFPADSDPGLNDKGFIYIPPDCERLEGCRVHVFFHGCGQSVDQVGEKLVNESGFLKWASTNRIIVLFPQTKTQISNPNGCWDWWGYSDLNYRTKQSPQILTIRKMLERLSLPRSSSQIGVTNGSSQ